MFGFRSTETQLNMMSGNIFNMIIFDKFKTGDPITDAIITTLILSLITYSFQYINKNIIDNINLKNILFIKNWNFWQKKYMVEYEGKISYSTNLYDCRINQTSAFGERFKALWGYIIENIHDNPSIYKIKEYSFTNPSVFQEDKKRDLGIYMVIQHKEFEISKELGIYAYASVNSETQEDDDKKNNNEKQKSSSKIEKINIELFSYKSNVKQITEFVEKITNNYLLSIDDTRFNKKFIYTLLKTKYEDSRFEMWDESVYSSTRTFNNLFFSGKNNVIKKLDFFLNNKEWYYEKGTPYSIGIGVHGPPGTGKTSLIKAIANYTNRHIIVISLKLIKTKKQLDSIFFEERYNSDNKKGSIKFDKKIIIFEDIDCIGDIVLDREKKKNNPSPIGIGKSLNIQDLNMTSKVNVGDLLETIASKENEKEKICYGPKLPLDEEPLTLDDILNLWDGIRETPGRIMIISSNHYYDLDPALIRPGRIDLTLELSYASREIIKEMYKHLFKQDIDMKKLQEINDQFYSPAEIMNIYMAEDMNPENFINRLVLNKKI